MPQTAVALYNDLADAHRVVDALTNAGFDSEQISLAAPDPDEEYAAVLEQNAEDDEESPREEAVDGALIGGALGGLAGLLLGLTAFSIPGLGPLLVAGPLYTTVMGAGIGGVSGGLLGALVEAGVPEEEAVFYEEGVRRGYTLVAVEADDQQAGAAVRILERNDPVDIARQAQSWQEAGWEAPEDAPDQFIPSVDDESDQHRYATGAMGEDMYGERASRSRPPLPTEEDDVEA